MLPIRVVITYFNLFGNVYSMYVVVLANIKGNKIVLILENSTYFAPEESRYVIPVLFIYFVTEMYVNRILCF